MDQRGGGGCCMARYAAGSYDMSKVHMIMMRFRPIAPKPATTNGGAPAPERGEPSSVKIGRCKRRRGTKDSNVNCCSGGRRKRTSTANTGIGGSVSVKQKVVETLSLLPEAPDVRESPNTLSREELPPRLSSGGVGRSPVVVVSSWVQVECVTEVGGYGWCGLQGRTDEERVMSLDADTCPGFISDGLNSVRWTNPAYRTMIGVGEEEKVVPPVVVVVEEMVALPVECAAFTCRVKVVTCGKKKKSCQTVPCDVCRLDCGGFAWRLDTAAALSLGW